MSSVLILGSSRSGTSILGELFDRAGLSQSYVTAEAKADLYHDGDPYDVFGRPGDPPSVYAEMIRVIQPFVTLWLVRHPLDAVCSLRPLVARGEHVPRPLNWRETNERPLVERCAAHWAYVNGDCYDVLSDSVTATVVHYERLVSDPEDVARELLELTGVSAPKREVSKWSRLVSPDKGGYEPERQKIYSTDEHVVRVGRWRDELTHEDLELVVPIVSEAASRFGVFDEEMQKVLTKTD